MGGEGREDEGRDGPHLNSLTENNNSYDFGAKFGMSGSVPTAQFLRRRLLKFLFK